jgi:mycothiol synthase
MDESRPFRPSDDERVVRLFARLHPDERTGDVSLDRWRALRAVSFFEDGRRFRVVEGHDGIVALVTAARLDSPSVPRGVVRARVYVDPRARRRGLGKRLLAECEAAARAEGVGAIESFVNGSQAGARAFAAACGFVVLARDLFLSRGAAPFSAAIPRGVRLRAYEPGRDEAAWVALSNATLSRDTGFTPETEAAVASYARIPGFALWMAEAGAPIGFCHLERRDGVGYVQAIGVLAEHTGRGVGAALLSRGIETLRAAGAARIELCTEENNARAHALYARAGFVFDRDAFTLRKPLA